MTAIRSAIRPAIRGAAYSPASNPFGGGGFTFIVDFSAYADQAEAEADGWIFGTGWSLSGGKAVHAAVVSSALKKDIGVSAGRTYSCTATIADRTAGSVYWRIGGQTNVGIMSANGTFTQDLTAEATDSEIEFFGDATFDGAIASARLVL